MTDHSPAMAALARTATHERRRGDEREDERHD